MTTIERANAFIRLGSFLDAYLQRMRTGPGELPGADPDDALLTSAIRSTLNSNPWFILPNVVLSLQSIACSLDEEEVVSFVQIYINDVKEAKDPASVCVIMAGNIPLVGFHDFFCVLLSGNRFIGKLSQDDRHLLPALARLLIRWFPDLERLIIFSEDVRTSFDAVIATGSNNSSRYFEYYFSKYPHIIRKSRNSVAVLDGTETPDELKQLGADVFSHFGRGCRSVSQIFVPAGYEPESIFPCWTSYQYVMDHHKYRNNYDYQKSVLIINDISFLDSGQILLIRNTAFSSPVAVMHFDFYDDLSEVATLLRSNYDRIQCIVSKNPALHDRIPFGKAQQPSLFDFADRIDTMRFLILRSK
ncbi:MAG TPA: acyl-CoA reductase [Bacteroidales bacterium]|nr:acyl-CoA reductase [Bacteroidales bacterium]HRZ21454.1 acyl-CoA reductase [Bacteroidales bacterium]